MNMPRFECQGCGVTAELNVFEADSLRQPCPECGEQTTWTVAFDAEEGVSF